MSQVQPPGLADLEKELGCSICTELLYQPLTLLDCLHTYCGSCLKEWFTAQGSRRQPRNASPKFTCPSCRAHVRDTRPNATVTTLLDMVLVAQPDRARSEAEKKEIAERYKPGDSVFPPPQAETGSSEDEFMEEIREMSLRENRGEARREERREERRRVQTEASRARSSNPDNRHGDDGRSRRRREEDSGHLTARTHGDSQRSRRVEHQSSLRSLLSLSSETETMEEEILRQIIEEGLLNDIDLENLGPAQEEELSERIAEAYRRRHMRQSDPRPAQRRRQSPETSSRSHTRSHSTQRANEEISTPREPGERRPPVSRPHLLESAAPRPTSGHQRRNSEQGSGNRRTSPVRVNQASNSDETLRPAVRSSSDMTAERTRSSQAGRPRAESSSRRPRRATESEQPLSDVWISGGRERTSSRNPTTSQSATNSPTTATSPFNASHSSTSTEHATPLSSPLVPNRSERRPRPSSSRPNSQQTPSIQYAEPSISCDRCGKSNIQYDLHKRCFKCKDGKYHICLRCYRSGQGCLAWPGFKNTALATFELMLASSNGQPAPTKRRSIHVLSSFKYQKPAEAARITMNGETKMTNDNPVRRLEAGLFCDICMSSTNECYWKCNQCNEGDWGFCNRCVNQGRCCTHPLLPVRRLGGISTSTGTANDSSAIEKSESYKILSFSTNCDICTYPIPASVTRFHCLECNNGDYDVCTNCYLKLVVTSKISKENGHSGWRRCLQGHRMIVVGFEDHQDGQRRVIVRDLVGGRALKDEHVNRSPSSSPTVTGPIASPELGNGDWSWREGQERRKKASRLRALMGSQTNTNTSSADSPIQSPGTPTSPHAPALRRFPPDGGVGLTVHALWSWYPEEDIQDELVFPRGADITEVENINDEWFWGCYAGRTGLFPGSHVVVTREA
ncbi:hypothetical protein N7456_009388 [Penicillium angulare]|uniref:Zinc finger, RING-type n=1 Tax=Penicillium angulare TaxID=116970 RepID=A0A9W9K635_9EURO|nr:hypothetical protein N7456_009388 [Penicillium angulare]